MSSQGCLRLALSNIALHHVVSHLVMILTFDMFSEVQPLLISSILGSVNQGGLDLYLIYCLVKIQNMTIVPIGRKLCQ
jgi:hypothetical protein